MPNGGDLNDPESYAMSLDSISRKVTQNDLYLQRAFFFYVNDGLERRETMARDIDLKPLLCYKREAQTVEFFNFLPLKKSLKKADSY